jgi:hypothetical protein
MINSPHFARSLARCMVNIYLVKTASVFMITTSTIALYTRLARSRLEATPSRSFS